MIKYVCNRCEKDIVNYNRADNAIYSWTTDLTPIDLCWECKIVFEAESKELDKKIEALKRPFIDKWMGVTNIKITQ